MNVKSLTGLELRRLENSLAPIVEALQHADFHMDRLVDIKNPIHRLGKESDLISVRGIYERYRGKLRMVTEEIERRKTSVENS